MDPRVTGPRERCPRGCGAVFTCGCRRRVQRAGDRWLGGAGGGGRGSRAPAASPPRGRVRAVVACPAVRRAGVYPRAPGGGGEPRAARPCPPPAPADARSRSAPSPRPRPAARRRARSLHLAAPPPPAPRLRPVFLWARQRDGRVQEVRCEDYDPRNRIRIARTPTGWRVIPRTQLYDALIAPPPPPPPPPPRARRERRRRRQRARRAPAGPAAPAAWLAPDLESHIPSHTIAVPRPPLEPTPLDNLLAVAELEFNQQRGSELELELRSAFLPEAEDMSFALGEPVFARGVEAPAPERAPDVDFPADLAVHKDLFDTISEAHYLPELGGPHDEALLESLVEKGCEDNQILGQALDKLAHLVHGAGDYAEEEDDMLLGGAPVADIIDRLEQSLESPSRSSMTAAQGLLHLHRIGDHLPPERAAPADLPYAPDRGFADGAEPEPASQLQDANRVNHLEYDQNVEKRLQQMDVDATDVLYTETVPDLPEHFPSDALEEQHIESVAPRLSPPPVQSEAMLPDASSDENTIRLEADDMKATIESDEPVPLTQENTSCEERCREPDVDNIDNVIKTELTRIETADEESSNEEMVPTDLSVKHEESDSASHVVASAAETTNALEDNVSEKSDDQPKDLSVHRRLPTPHASPRRIEIPRAPSRESDAMQSPQPSGIPAVPSSPEIFTMPLTKSKQSLFLETLLSSPSPKMYTSEVTITKQQCEPLNLGKHRKSASPTVTSCSDEIRKLNKEFGEPQEKKMRRESTEDLAKIIRVFNKCDRDDIAMESFKSKKLDKLALKSINDDTSPVKQLQMLKAHPEFNIPDPLLIPKDKLSTILAAPAREIPALLIQRPELRLPEAFAFPAILQDPDILVISLAQLENIAHNEAKATEPPPPKVKKADPVTPKSASSTVSTEHTSTTTQPDQISQSSQPKPIPSMDALAGDIDAATNAALNHMLWLPYFSQLEAMAACSQTDFLKSMNSAGYPPFNCQDLTAMINNSAAAARFMGSAGFPMMPQMDYDNRMHFALWQEAMNASRAKAMETSKDQPSKSSDVQNPYVHSTKNHQSKSHNMSSRTSPMTHNYSASQRAAMQHHQFLQNMYPGMNPNIRPNVPLPGLQIPYFNPNMMGSQRSPRSGQQKSPTSPYYPNNNYLQSVKQSESQSHQRSSSTGSQESPRPRISVKSLQNLLEPTAASTSASSSRRASNPTPMGRRREEPEVGSTTQGEPTAMMPPHPHDPSSFHLWHPLFGNQKSYNSPWSWTTVTATGD